MISGQPAETKAATSDMTYSFKKTDKSVEKAVRRIARVRMNASLAALADPSTPMPLLVHELRKNVKRTRGLLRLVRPAFAGFATENTALRDAARRLSDLREQAVMIDTFDRIAQGADIPPETLAAVRTSLLDQKVAPNDPGKLLQGHAAAISAIHRRLHSWSIDGKGFDTLSGGLERSWIAAQKAMRSAATDPSAEALHVWRKRVKDHWYHATLLSPVWPQMMKPHIAIADDLGETLGDARDIAILVRALERVDGTDAFRALAAEHEAQLLAKARATGKLLLSESAASLSDRWRGWWDLWRG